MQANAPTLPNGSIKPPLQRRQFSPILGGLGNVLGGTSTPTTDRSSGSNPSAGGSQVTPPNAQGGAPTAQPAAPNANSASQDARPSTSPPASPAGSTAANPPALPAGSTAANPPASPAGSTTANPSALPAGSNTELPPSSASTTPSPASNTPASNSLVSTPALDVPAKNATPTFDPTPSPAFTANASTPSTTNITSTSPDVNRTNTSNTTVTPIVSTTIHNLTALNTPTTNTVGVTSSSRAPVSSVLPGPFVPNSDQKASQDSSSGLSTGAITGIAVIAGVIGFIILFWIGVQMLQSKLQKREEASMQEIDFDPSGGSSVNGDTFPGQGHNQSMPPSAGYGSFGQRFSMQDHGDTQYEDNARICAEYISSTEPSTPNMAGVGGGALNRQPTVGAVSLTSNQSVKHPQGHYGQDLTRQASYSRPSAHSQYAQSYSCFDTGPPMPTYPYVYQNKPSSEVPNYLGDIHSSGYQGAGTMSYGNMVAQSNSSSHPPTGGDFCYPPPNNSPHIAM
ncbi:hypothetical protein DFH28DRAFT_662927 [Melampsora americana]|nr:hypothetical protein DFH28DRAFT_662927 [Melampsora americana]